MADGEPSYIDYEVFLDPTFSPVSFANTLITSTNDASDTQLDLSTPLSRVLFDVQEIDTHIHALTTKSALPLLNYTQEQSDSGQTIVKEIEAQVASLTDGYRRLEEEVIRRHEAAEAVRLTAERAWQTVKLGRAVGRCLQLGRQLEAQVVEIGLHTSNANKIGNHKAMVRASNTLLSLRQLFAASGPGEEGQNLGQVHVIITMESDLVVPSELKLRTRAQQIVREFSLSSLALPSNANPQSTVSAPITYAQTEETKARTTSACLVLYLLSPASGASHKDFEPSLLLNALQSYLQTSLTSSLASMARALSTLPTLSRTLLEVSARCQNISALEVLLESIRPPSHPLLSEISSTKQALKSAPLHAHQGSDESSPAAPVTLLQPLLLALDTSSLPSFFWRSLASGLSGRIQDILNKGGVSARTLRSQREKVRESIRECVVRGCQGARVRGQAGGWDREVGVMVGSVVGVLGR
ncbi:hypothetical protein MMC14_008511 [Varicellaria rhodocarpa]|nr:hypothetical protein [Varicellaria rhodocarpa]